MEIIILANASRRRVQLSPLATRLLWVLLVVMAGALFYSGARFGLALAEATPDAQVLRLQREAERQRAAVAEAIRSSRENLDALAVSLGQMQAQAVRLDALGVRLVEMAKLDPAEFDFDSPPAVGGPRATRGLRSQQIPDFLRALDQLAARLEDREPKMWALERLLMNRKLAAEIHPSGRPVKQGWVSSAFGYRTDPVSGKRAFHEGVDFAGPPRGEVVAVAAGVVSAAGYRMGYGNVVEINHGNGYSTRYAHNRRNLVSPGETVKKGQRVALLGSTGRTTGTHVHFEVLYRGKPVNPSRFINSGG